MAANFCDNCGEKLAEGVKFCPACGKSLTDTGKIKPTDKLQDVGHSKQVSQQGTVPPTIQPVVQRRDGDLAEMLFSFNGRLNRQRYFWRMLCIGMVLGMISLILTGVGMLIGDLSIIIVSFKFCNITILVF